MMHETETDDVATELEVANRNGATVPVAPIIRPNDLPRYPSVAAMGFFDGVHRGHQALIERAIEIGKSKGLRILAVTFDRHPMSTIRPTDKPPLLMTARQRLDTLSRSGVDVVVSIPFDAAMAALPAETFVHSVLVNQLGVRHVVVGEDFRFGRGGEGDVALLQRLLEKCGLSAEALGDYTYAGERVSSTWIRGLIKAGQVAKAERLLGRSPVLECSPVGVRRPMVRSIDVQCETIRPNEGLYRGRLIKLAGSGVECTLNVKLGAPFSTLTLADEHSFTPSNRHSLHVALSAKV